MLNQKIKQSNKPNQTNDQAKEKKKKKSAAYNKTLRSNIV